MRINMYELVTYLKDKAYDKAPKLTMLVGVLMNSPIIEKKALYRMVPMESAELEEYLDYLEGKEFITTDNRNIIHTEGLELLLSRAETHYYSLKQEMPISVF